MASPTLPPLSAADKARLAAEGQAAIGVLADYAGPLGLAFLTNSPINWAATVLPLLGKLSAIVTPADVKLGLSYLVDLGKITAFEARLALIFVAKHAPHLTATIDPNDPSTWYLGASGLPLEQTQADADAYAATTGTA